uniref:Uncharacterized protein n=1 Tax=Theropithecus gelada TaxID=9565 RepID=A0A8D2GEW6_THEGE
MIFKCFLKDTSDIFNHLVKVEMTILCRHKRNIMKYMASGVSLSKTCCSVSVLTCHRSSNSFTRLGLGRGKRGAFPRRTVRNGKTP